MKKIFIFIILMALAIIVVACGTTNNDTNETPDEPIVEDNTNDETNGANGTNESGETDGNTGTNSNQGESAGNQDALQKTMDELGYTEFKLEVDYGNQDEYEVEIEVNGTNLTDVEIEDSINGVKKKGQEAIDELDPIVNKLTIDQETSKEDAIKEVLEVFNLQNDYSKFDLEITFNDGTEIEFKDTK